ncbi:TIR domain-containing protein [Teredinibacter turnerae]|uniref:TIR domain-containing protein n=1 Tax=Teredinibacter turnerae TaxID=2426 RepID=UPI00036105B0|nr:TIR domain-containing protein [Teredinibacter turnerae]
MNEETINIAIVSDNRVDSLILEAILGKIGYSIVRLEGKQELTNLMEDKTIQIVLLDVEAWERRDYEELLEIRALLDAVNSNLIVLTRDSDISSYVQLIDNGADDVYIKPYSTELIASKIKALLRLQGKQPSFYRGSAPKVFISYSHDNDEHKNWVLKFAGELQVSGVNVFLDIWDLGPGDSLTKFMNRAINESEKILVVCTKNYYEKSSQGKGGVGYESQILSSDMLKNTDGSKCIPIVRSSSEHIPIFLSGRVYCNFENDASFNEDIEMLLRAIHGTPRKEHLKPALGKNPFL